VCPAGGFKRKEPLQVGNEACRTSKIINKRRVVAISYGIIRIAKYHREDILGIEIHDKRKSEKGNSKLD
jgi:hypothetical protein